MGCLTIIISIFNVIFWLLGGAMIGLGVWILVDDAIYDYLVLTGEEVYWDIALYIIISVGGIIFLVGVLGCIGACTANKCIIIVYGIFVVIAILAELGAITVVSIFYANLDTVKYNMQSDVRYGYINEDNPDSLTQAWNKMQIEWECCGSDSSSDYRGSRFDLSNNSTTMVPWTCCVLKDDVDHKYATIDDVLSYRGCQAEAISGFNSYYVNRQGCYYEMKDVMDIAAPVTLGVLSAFVTIQMIALGMSCAMMNKNQSVGPGGGK